MAVLCGWVVTVVVMLGRMDRRTKRFAPQAVAVRGEFCPCWPLVGSIWRGCAGVLSWRSSSIRERWRLEPRDPRYCCRPPELLSRGAPRSKYFW